MISLVKTNKSSEANSINNLIVRGISELADYELNKPTIKNLHQDYQRCEFIYQYPPPVCLPPLDSDIVTKTMEKTSHQNKKLFGLYLHIPFCPSICSYCHYSRWIPKNANEIDQYLKALGQEMQVVDRYLNAKKHCVTTVHFGGGTPTYLTSSQIRHLFDMVYTVFKLSKNVEITWETTPYLSMLKHIETIREMGGNRISIGVQSLNEQVLKLCNRNQTYEEIIHTIKAILGMGFEKINIDVIFGLPGQNLKSWINTIQELIGVDVHSITMYRLRILGGEQELRNETIQLPNLKECDLMYVIGRKMLRQAGYLQISPSCFLQKGSFLYKHQYNKSQGGEYIGLGLSSYSYFGNIVRFNTRNTEKYHSLIQANKLPVQVGKILTEEENTIRKMILTLRYSDGINPSLTHHIDKLANEDILQNLNRLYRLKLLERRNNWIKLTKLGQVLADEVCAELYEQKYKEELKQKGLRFGAYFTRPKVSQNSSIKEEKHCLCKLTV